MTGTNQDFGAPQSFAAYFEFEKDNVTSQFVVFAPAEREKHIHRYVERQISESSARRRWKWQSAKTGELGGVLSAKFNRFEKLDWEMMAPVIVEYSPGSSKSKADDEVRMQNTPYRILRWLDARCEELGRMPVQRG